MSALVTPRPLTKHGELGDPDDPPASAKLLSTTFGVRDLVSGLTIVAAPAGRPLQAALAARVAFDAGDAAGFALLAPTRGPGSRSVSSPVRGRPSAPSP